MLMQQQSRRNLSARSRKWTLESAWQGNLLTLLASISMLIALLVFSQGGSVRIIVPKFVLELVAALDACIAITALVGCFFRSIRIEDISMESMEESSRTKSFDADGKGRNSAMFDSRRVVPVRAYDRASKSPKRRRRLSVKSGIMIALFVCFLGLFAWRLWMTKVFLDWMYNVQAVEEFIALKEIGTVNPSIAAESTDSALQKFPFTEFFILYNKDIGASKWFDVQNSLSCCGYYSKNSTSDLFATGSLCSSSLSQNSAVKTCIIPLAQESRRQTRIIAAISIINAFIQGVNLVIVWELSYESLSLAKSILFRCRRF